LLSSNFAQSSSKFLCIVGGCEEELDTTSINNLHRYDQGLDYLSIGNIGLSGYRLLYNIEDYSMFSISRTIGNKKYLPKQFDVKRPYTELSYILGSKEEQVLGVLHTQNISEQANFSFGFDKVKSTGFYNNQASNNNHLFANIWFSTKKEKYKISLNIDHERIFNEHNGGIQYDSIFEQDLLLNRNRELMDVNLSLASSTIKRSELQLNQKFRFMQSLDSLNNGVSHALYVNAKGFINERVYKDSILNMDFYDEILFDSLTTNDKVKFEGVEGVLGYEFSNRKRNQSIVFSPYVKWQSINYDQHLIDTNVSTLSVGTDLSISQKKFQLKLEGDYHLHGYRNSDVDFKSEFSYVLSENWSFGILGSFNSVSPSLDLLSYYGNNISWENTFSTTEYINLSGKIFSKKHKTSISVAYNDVFNPVYFNFIGEPQQIDGVSQIIQLTAQKEFQIQKWSIKPKMVYQYNGGYNIYRLPEYYTDLVIGYKTQMYKNNLNIFIGADVVYYAPTDMMAFSPMVNQYYLDDTKAAGNYPFVDIFLNARIKTVRFFVKATHVNSGLFGYKYYGANHYPLKDRTIQFGLNWIFIN